MRISTLGVSRPTTAGFLTAGLIADIDIDRYQSVNGLSNGDPVTALTNFAGGNNGEQATSGNRGVIATNQQNGKSAIFVETNKFYNFGDILSGKTKGTIYFLGKRYEQGVTHGLWTNAQSQSSSNQADLYAFASDRIYTAWGRNERIDFNPIVNLSSSYRLYTVVADTNDFRVYVDGVLRYSTATSTVAFPIVFELFRSLSVAPSTYFYWRGWMLRLLIYDVSHSFEEVTENSAMFNSKYAL